MKNRTDRRPIALAVFLTLLAGARAQADAQGGAGGGSGGAGTAGAPGTAGAQGGATQGAGGGQGAGTQGGDRGSGPGAGTGSNPAGTPQGTAGGSNPAQPGGPQGQNAGAAGQQPGTAGQAGNPAGSGTPAQKTNPQGAPGDQGPEVITGQDLQNPPGVDGPSTNPLARQPAQGGVFDRWFDPGAGYLDGSRHDFSPFWLWDATGARWHTQPGRTPAGSRAVHGRVDASRDVDTGDERGDHKIVRVGVEGGQSAFVDLGPRADLTTLGLTPGAYVDVRGEPGTVAGRPVLVASALRAAAAGGASGAAGGAGAAAARPGETEVAGKLISLRPASILGAEQNRSIARLELGDGRQMLVDLGASTGVGALDLVRGSWVQFRGNPVEVLGHPVLMVDTLHVDGELRLGSPPATEPRTGDGLGAPPGASEAGAPRTGADRASDPSPDAPLDPEGAAGDPRPSTNRSGEQRPSIPRSGEPVQVTLEGRLAHAAPVRLPSTDGRQRNLVRLILDDGRSQIVDVGLEADAFAEARGGAIGVRGTIETVAGSQVLVADHVAVAGSRRAVRRGNEVAPREAGAPRPGQGDARAGGAGDGRGGRGDAEGAQGERAGQGVDGAREGDPREQAPGSVRSFAIVASGGGFAPSTLTVSPGERVRITLQNQEDAAQSIEFDFGANDVRLREAVEPGRSNTFEFSAPTRPGSYAFYSPLEGQRAAGMRGTLVVR